MGHATSSTSGTLVEASGNKIDIPWPTNLSVDEEVQSPVSVEVRQGMKSLSITVNLKDGNPYDSLNLPSLIDDVPGVQISGPSP